MLNRRTFLKSFVLAGGVASVPMVVKAEPKPFVFDDIGPRGIGQMTEREHQAVKADVSKRLNMEVRWGIPGSRDNIDNRFAVLGRNYLVTTKTSHRSGVVYIEVERTFTGEPSQDLTRHIDAVWMNYMDKRTGRIS